MVSNLKSMVLINLLYVIADVSKKSGQVDFSWTTFNYCKHDIERLRLPDWHFVSFLSSTPYIYSELLNWENQFLWET